ncbi:alpha/beta-hydrolase [Hortaea werneckii]|nr:alpha/beta-hydrolase [Hortaea werneckii]
MMRNANRLLVCLLALSDYGEAARAPQQRRQQRNPYLILPPTAGEEYGSGIPWQSQDLGELDFSLRHIYHHGSHEYPYLHRYLDVPSDAKLRVSYDYGESFDDAPEHLKARASTMNIERLAKRSPADIDHILSHADIHGEAATLPSSAWTIDEIPAPNTTDRNTVLTFAKMASNAYVQDHADGDWKDVKGGFNYTDDFGWEADGLRGHIFADQTNRTIVIGLKGTSGPIFDDPDTVGNDRGRVLRYLTALTRRSLRERSHYYHAVRDLYHNVTARYPEADAVWLSGHSLGGVVSALLGLTYGLPVLTFEAFPDALAASRLGLPTPPGYRIGSHQSRSDVAIHHFGHTADPIFMGTCNAASSFCTIAGYAFQGVCHTGRTCTYDTVGDLGWRVGIGTHKIGNVIKDVLEKYDTVPSCEEDVECQDCFNWKFYESNSSDPITSTSTSSSSSSATRTETYLYLYQFHIDLQNTRLVRLQRPYHGDFTIILHGFQHAIRRPRSLNHHNVNSTKQYQHVQNARLVRRMLRRDQHLCRAFVDFCAHDTHAYQTHLLAQLHTAADDQTEKVSRTALVRFL